MNKSHICPIHDDCSKKTCIHGIAHEKRFDCYKRCFKGESISGSGSGSGAKCVEFPKLMSAETYETAPVNRVIIAKNTPKATRHHMRNNNE